jgi:hypothetical protein
MAGRSVKAPQRWSAPLGLVLNCPLSLALSEGISNDVPSGMIYHRRETGILAQRLSPTT